MDSKLFNPSIDWSHALPDSLLWIAMAWAISAVGVVAVVALLRVSTRWGGSSGRSPVATSPGVTAPGSG